LKLFVDLTRVASLDGSRQPTNPQRDWNLSDREGAAMFISVATAYKPTAGLKPAAASGAKA